MGELMREYWVPALMSSELPAPDCPPLRVKLLGEELIAFRDSSGRVGLVAQSCPHRGASLFFGRNEEDGLRCVYHGWKFDVSGRCVDMPSEPAESNFKDKVRATVYRCIERGGLVWTYMGPRNEPPPLPDLEPNMQGESCIVTAIQRECNWLQGLEGDIDTSHATILHEGSVPLEAAIPGTFGYYNLADRAPRYKVVDTDFGTMYGAYKPAGEGELYWRIAHFLFPFYSMTPTGVLGLKVIMNARVPMDDGHTMHYSMSVRQRGPAGTDGANGQGGPGLGAPPQRTDRGLNGSWGLMGGAGYLPNTSDWLGRWRTAANKGNDYLIDRDAQRQNASYTGIVGIGTQDQAITESMGEIYDRSREHLGTSDSMIVKTRQRLLDAAKALRDHGQVPPGVDEPAVYRVRSGGIILPQNADWIEATRDRLRAFEEHPELDSDIVGIVSGVAL
jgi:nitrite reductase/ring-hydroxylating ferredoxin subunit